MSRLGRGAALKKLIAEQEQGKVEEQPVPPPEQQEEISSGRRGMGRGAIFASLMNTAAGDANSGSASTSVTPDSSISSLSGAGDASKPSMGRGRGFLLASLAQQQGDVAKVKSDTSPPLVEEYRKRDPSPTSSVASSVSEMSLQEKPPVVMKGTHGHAAEMTCNYIQLSFEPGKGVFEYEVRYSPDVDSQKYRYDLLYQHKELIGDTRTFDGTVLYLPFQLPDTVTMVVGKLPSDGSEVNIKIMYKRQKRLGETIHLYNVLFRKIMNHLGFVLMGKNFFDPTSGKPIPQHKLEVWPGFVTAVDEYEGGVMLCCDASHRVLRTVTCLELLEDLQQVMSDNWKKYYIDLVVGKCVLTRYNNRTYRVDDVLFNESPTDTFPCKNGTEISFVDYYKKQYDISIKCRDQPLLISKKVGRLKGQEMTQMVRLIPELCFITGLTDEMRADMKVMKDVAQFTRISPHQRHMCLKKFIHSVNNNDIARKILGNWGLKLEDNTISLPGRIIPPEDILFDNNRVANSGLQADWGKASTSNPVLSAVHLKKWMICYPSKEDKAIREFVDMLKKCSNQFGMRIETPQFLPISDDRTETYLNMLRRQINPEMQLAIIIMTAARVDKYSAVKKLCCINNPIPSQVVLMKTIRRPDRLRSVSQKIALQMNCKLGGTLWSVKIPMKKIMVIGIDTYHDPTRKSPSISAIVASLNQPLTRWYSKTGRQEVGQELMDSIVVNFVDCLNKHMEVNASLPDQILVFRDGVGDGQLNYCLEYEVKQLIKACHVFQPSYNPKFLFVVVQKKINTRLFLNTTEGKVDNPPPGSIMDHSICRRNWFDFFLVSQCVRQGTVSPTHYVVVYNTTTMTPDQVQRLSYKLTHLYYNWPGTIRVPAPCQYAHKLAFLVGENIQREADKNLLDKLFYL